MLKKKIKKCIGSEKGFSLIEILISMSIFIMIIGAVVLFSVRTLEAHTKSQAMQSAVENARFAIETLNKKIRTSHDIKDLDDVTQFTIESPYLFFIDNVDGSRNCYYFNAVTNTLQFCKGPDDTTLGNCQDLIDDGQSFVDLAGGSGNVEVTGRFFIKESDPASEVRGFVRTVVEINYNDGGRVAEKDTVVIQSGVSLRDY